MKPFFDPHLAARLASLTLNTRRPMLGSVSGHHQSPHRGSSVEFAEYRRYQPGDDLRRLDWRAYGRSDRHYVKEFEADTNLRLLLVVDASGSMDFRNKWNATCQAAATLAYLAIKQGDAAGLLTVGGTSPQQFLPPRRSSSQVSLLFEQLDATRCDGPTRIESGLHELAESIRERALVVILSDLLFEPPALQHGLEHLAFRNHDIAVFHLTDPGELQPQWDRPVRVEDMESNDAMLIDPEELRDGYQAAVNEHLQQIREACRQNSADYHQMMTDQSIEPELMAFLAGRS